MANSGYKNWLTLRKYVNGIATDTTKSNTSSDPDYIAPVLDTTACPTTANNCPQIISAISDITADVGDNNTTIDLTTVFSDSDGDSLTYTASSTNSVSIGASISGSNLIISYLSGTAALSTITVTADDGTCSATDSFSVTLNEVITPTAPTVPTVPTTPTPPTCPDLITVASASFNLVGGAQTYTSLGGWCYQTQEDTEGEKWYIDINSTTPNIYIWEFSGGAGTSCPSGTTSPVGTEISSWTYDGNTITPGAGTELWNSGIEWTYNSQTYDIILETAGNGRELINVYAAPQCGAAPATPPTAPTPTAYSGLRRCDNNTSTWYTTQTVSSGTMYESTTGVCYVSEGTIYDISGKTFIDGTITSFGGNCDCDCYGMNC